jgi:shikimate kinase
MKKNGIVVWLNPSVAVLANRLQLAGQDRPLLEGIPSHKLEEYIQLKLKERSFFYEQAHFQLSESTPDPAALIKLIQHG